MTLIHATTVIDASIERCFLLSLNIDLELQASAKYGLKAIGGITTGTIGPGQTVTWAAKQFGIKVIHQTRITGYGEPAYFQDSMVSGIFRSFKHDHYFEAIHPRQTLMRDELAFSMPILLLGSLTERAIVKRRLTNLLTQRNTLIKHQAESHP